MNNNILVAFTDGGSRGNPGPAALGVYIEDGAGTKLYEHGETLGIATNNIAEYSALLHALTWIQARVKNHPEIQAVTLYLDSQLVVMQMKGLYKIKNKELMVLASQIKDIEKALPIAVSYSHIPREQNKKADRMVNFALDNKI